MKYEVESTLEAVEDVLRITIASGSKTQVVNASKQILEALRFDPAAAGEHLSERLLAHKGSATVMMLRVPVKSKATRKCLPPRFH